MRTTMLALLLGTAVAGPAFAEAGSWQCERDLAEARSELFAKAPALTPPQEEDYLEKLDVAESYCNANLQYPSSAMFGDLHQIRRELETLDTSTAALPSTPYPID
ncbi:MAG: hypothetical protein HQL39_05400 [Alphaproteobacteria bacterium]|nr:hypothetical protein [Alphaproteobacteria bacterium]